MNQPYDALLVVSFGGPEGMDDVMPFLSNVLRGRNVPESRIREVAHHYELFGGVSPINGQNRRLIAALEQLLESERPAPARLLGQSQLAPAAGRHAPADARRRGQQRARLHHLGLQFLLGLPPVPRRHRARARGRGRRARRASRSCVPSTTTPDSSGRTSRICAPRSDRFPKRGARQRAWPSRRTASPPRWPRAATTSVSCLRPAASSADGAGAEHWRLVFQSRSGPPTQPWLEPDICDHLRALKGEGVARRGCRAGRLHLRPHGGALRPRHGGAAGLGRDRPQHDSRRDGRHASRVRPHDS